MKALAANADALKKNADGAGIAFGAFQKLEFGLQQAGLASGGLQKAMLKINEVMKSAGEGSKAAVDDLAKIGLTMADLQQMKPEDRFRAIADGLNGIQDKGERAALAVKLLGTEFADRDFSTADLDEAASNLVTISDSAALAASDFGSALNLLQTNVMNLVTNALGPLLPHITNAANALAQFSRENPLVTNIILGLTGIAAAVAAIGAVVTLVGGPVTIALAALAAAVAAIVVVTNNWDAVVKSVTKFLADVFGTDVQTVTGYMEDFGNWISTVADWLKNRLLDGLELVKSAFTTSFEVFKTLLSAVWDLATLDFASFGQKMMDAFKLVGQFFSDNFGGIIKHLTEQLRMQFGWAFEKVAETFMNAIYRGINWMMGHLETMINKIISVINWLGGSVDPVSFQPRALSSGVGSRPEWQSYKWNEHVGSTTGTGLTSAVLPPAPGSTTTTTSPGGGSGGGGGKSDAQKAAEKEAEALKKLRDKQAADALAAAQRFSENILGGMASAFAQGIKTGNWKDALHGWLDQITNQIIDNFSKNLMDALFGDTFENIFKSFGNSVEQGMSKALNGANTSGGGGILGGLFSGFGNWLGGIFGFNQGGIVPTTPYSQIGKDSVPAMLTPGELIVPVDEVGNYGGSGGSVVNINITGDISRQTKQEVYKMLPDLTLAINNQNTEVGYR